MLTVAELDKLRNVPITERTGLSDICDIEVDRTLPRAERMERYLEEIKNPYLFRAGDVVVKIEPRGNARLADVLGRILAG